MAGKDERLKALRLQWTEATVELLNAQEAVQLIIDREALVYRPGWPGEEPVAVPKRPEDMETAIADHKAATQRVMQAELKLAECERAYFGAIQSTDS